MIKQDKDRSISLERVKTQYPDEWILLKVTEENELNEPVRGVVLAHSRVKEEVLGLSRDLKDDIALFFTGAIPKKGYAFEFALHREDEFVLMLKKKNADQLLRSWLGHPVTGERTDAVVEHDFVT